MLEIVYLSAQAPPEDLTGCQPFNTSNIPGDLPVHLTVFEAWPLHNSRMACWRWARQCIICCRRAFSFISFFRYVFFFTCSLSLSYLPYMFLCFEAILFLQDFSILSVVSNLLSLWGVFRVTIKFIKVKGYFLKGHSADSTRFLYFRH